MGKKSRRAVATVAPLEPGAEIPVVGQREPCPCGSGKRYKACHGRGAREVETPFVARPFEGVPGECDWVAMRQFVPAATAVVRTTKEYGDAGIVVTTVLPMAMGALHRSNGEVLVALQTTVGSPDASRDAAWSILTALESAPGTSLAGTDSPGPGPRLQDVLDPATPFEVTVHPGFDYWLQDDAKLDAAVKDSMERANAAAVPTERLTSVEAAYWCRIGNRRHLRWAVPHEEERLLDGLARLHAAGASALVEGSRYVGSFRADGIVVPVWDLAADTEPDELEKPAAVFAERLGEAMAAETDLTAEERRARAGLAGRQVTLR
jgi:hypothetical protein